MDDTQRAAPQECVSCGKVFAYNDPVIGVGLWYPASITRWVHVACLLRYAGATTPG